MQNPLFPLHISSKIRGLNQSRQNLQRSFSGPVWFLNSYCTLHTITGSMVAQMVKCLSTMRETWVQSLGWEDSLEKEMATHSSTPALKIPWTEELGAGYYPWGRKESGTTEWLHFHFQRADSQPSSSKNARTLSNMAQHCYIRRVRRLLVFTHTSHHWLKVLNSVNSWLHRKPSSKHLWMLRVGS